VRFLFFTIHMPFQTYKIIVNPASGVGRTGRTWRETERAARQILGDCDVDCTRAAKDATILTSRALNEGFTHIIAVGGDGTLNETLNGFFVNDRLINPDASLSFIPSGTGSDVAKTLGVPTDKTAALHRIASLRAERARQKLDVGKMSFLRLDDSPFTGYFLNVASFGMSGNVVRFLNASPFLKRFGGKTAFFVASMIALGQYSNALVRLRVERDEEIVFDKQFPARLVASANGRFFGGGMAIAPNAAPNDGLLDVVVVEGLSALQTALKFPKIYTGAHLAEEAVSVARGNRITAHTDTTVWIDADGEFPGKLPLTIELLPSVLNFI
jgi:YegS/Rv2252/BmrU family lipid kinase